MREKTSKEDSVSERLTISAKGSACWLLLWFINIGQDGRHGGYSVMRKRRQRSELHCLYSRNMS